MHDGCGKKWKRKFLLSCSSSLVRTIVIVLAVLARFRSALTPKTKQICLDLTVGSNAGFDNFQGKQQEAVLAALDGEALYTPCFVPLQEQAAWMVFNCVFGT